MFIDWGPEFQAEHAAAYPELTNTGRATSTWARSGSIFCWPTRRSGYFPRRLVKRHVNRRRLRIPARARAFTYPVYMVYPEARDEEAYEPQLFSFGSSQSRRLSPNRLKANTASVMATPGNTIIHGAVW